jgi:hypothetical protein
MTTMYLVFQWTDERESKIHIAICSTLEKAKAAAQLDTDGQREGWFSGTADAASVPLDWKTYPDPSETGTYADPGFGQDNRIYEIEEYELDVYRNAEWDAANQKTLWEEIAL